MMLKAVRCLRIKRQTYCGLEIIRPMGRNALVLAFFVLHGLDWVVGFWRRF